MASSSLAKKWRELQGEREWKGLMQPLDLDLRCEIIRYGEFIQAVYDGIDYGDESKFQYFSNFGKSTLFSKVGLGDTKHYNITRYFYSTQKTGFLQLLFGPTKAVWMGYIAVSDDEESRRLGRRDIVVVFRGTLRNIEWIYNIRFVPVSFPTLNGSTKGVPEVHKGFLGLYNDSNPESGFGDKSMRMQIMDELKHLVFLYKDDDISITVVGHSLGGALATLCSYDIANSKVNVKAGEHKPNGLLNPLHLAPASSSIPVTAFLFASPKVGGNEFKNKAEKLVKILRISDRRDIVPLLPPPSLVYREVGVEFQVDGSQSNYVKFSHFWELSKPHNLEGYMHTVAGLHHLYSTPASIIEKVLDVPLNIVGGLTKTVTSTAGAVVTSVTKTVAVIPLPIDEAIKKLIGNDPEGGDVFDKLKKLFFDDLGTLQDFFIRVINIRMGSEDFKLEVKRDLALVNKSEDLLKPEHEIPKQWWVLPNKGMEFHEADHAWLPRHKRFPDNPTLDNPEFI